MPKLPKPAKAVAKKAVQKKTKGISKAKKVAKKEKHEEKPFSAFRPHPWHGLDFGPGAKDMVNAFIEITPYDLVKYEIDKKSGFIRVDRPQLTSSTPPTLYGFIPRTLSA